MEDETMNDAMEASLARAVETLVVSPATSSKSTRSNLITTASSNLTTGSMETLQDALERPSNLVLSTDEMESSLAVTLTESTSIATLASLTESRQRTDYVPAGSSLIKRPTFTFEALIHKNQVNETAGEFL